MFGVTAVSHLLAIGANAIGLPAQVELPLVDVVILEPGEGSLAGHAFPAPGEKEEEQ